MKTAILISSCDAFDDCWGPMIYSLKKYWSDCPYPIYFISNFHKIDDEKIHFINVGKDEAFASNLKFSLQELSCDYIIYFQDDYFLVDYVNTEAIKTHVSHCHEKDIDFLKLHANDFFLRDNYRIGDSDYCTNPIDLRYTINTSVAVWKKSTLETLCVEGYSGWEWERSIISYIHKQGININSEMLHSSCYKTKAIVTLSGGAVAKGRWTRNGMHFLQNNGFEDLFEKREVEGKLITHLAVVYNRYPKSLLKYPIVAVLRFLQKIKINI